MELEEKTDKLNELRQIIGKFLTENKISYVEAIGFFYVVIHQIARDMIEQSIMLNLEKSFNFKTTKKQNSM